METAEAPPFLGGRSECRGSPFLGADLAYPLCGLSPVCEV